MSEFKLKPFLDRDVLYRATKDRIEKYRTHDFDDIPEEYAVVREDDANGGIVVYAMYRGEWTANPWNCRHLIRAILDDK